MGDYSIKRAARTIIGEDFSTDFEAYNALIKHETLMVKEVGRLQNRVFELLGFDEKKDDVDNG